MGRCLDSLFRQTRPADEVIVVDNNSTDGSGDLVRARPEPTLRCLTERTGGVAAARNAGVAAASSELCAFVDDDEIAPPDWLERLTGRLAACGPETAAVGGGVSPVWEAPRPPWLTDRMLILYSARLTDDPTPRWFTGEESLMEGNIIYRRAVLLAQGGFPPELGRIGSRQTSSEGVVNRVIAAAGHRLFMDPSITVEHLIHADRLHRRWVRQAAFWSGASRRLAHDYLARRGLPPDPLVRKMMFEPLTFGVWLYGRPDMSAQRRLQTSLLHLWRMGYALAGAGVLDDLDPPGPDTSV